MALDDLIRKQAKVRDKLQSFRNWEMLDETTFVSRVSVSIPPAVDLLNSFFPTWVAGPGGSMIWNGLRDWRRQRIDALREEVRALNVEIAAAIAAGEE